MSAHTLSLLAMSCSCSIALTAIAWVLAFAKSEWIIVYTACAAGFVAPIPFWKLIVLKKKEGSYFRGVITGCVSCLISVFMVVFVNIIYVNIKSCESVAGCIGLLLKTAVSSLAVSVIGIWSMWKIVLPVFVFIGCLNVYILRKCYLKEKKDQLNIQS